MIENGCGVFQLIIQVGCSDVVMYPAFSEDVIDGDLDITGCTIYIFGVLSLQFIMHILI